MWEDKSAEVFNVLASFKTLDTLEQQLNYILILLYSLEGESQKIFEAEIIKFEKIITDVEFMRLVRYRDSLVHDYKTEYFGRDYSPDDPFLYQEQLEHRINEISIEILAVLGRVIKVMSDTEIHIGDEA